MSETALGTAPSRTTFVVFAAVFALSFLIYSNTFHSSFHFDDMKEIAQNPYIQKLPHVSAIWDRHKTRFVTYLTFALNYSFGKLDVSGYHFVNILLHGLCGFLVYYLAALLLKTPRARDSVPTKQGQLVAFFASLIFISHPVQTQAVTYIVQRAASLATLFYVLALVFYLKMRLGKRKVYYALSVLAAAAAVLSKPIAVTLPFAVLLMEILFLGSQSAGGWKQRLRLIGPFVVTAMAPFFLVKAFGSYEFAGVGDVTKQTEIISRADYLLTQFNVIRTYGGILFFPVNQNLDYDYLIARTFFDAKTFFSFMFLALIVFLAVKICKKHRMIAFGIFLFLLALIPESSLYPLQDVIFEHRLYLPMTGFSIFLAMGWWTLLRDQKKFIASMLVVVAIFSIATYRRNFVWADELTLWNDVVRKSPNKAGGYQMLGTTYQLRGNFDKAIEYYEKAIQVFDRSPLANRTPKAGTYVNLGLIYDAKGDLDREIRCYWKAIEINPELADGYLNLGAAYGKKGENAKEIECYEKIISIDPRYYKAYGDLGAAYMDRGDVDRAVQNYQKALEINPSYTEALYNLGGAYVKKGDRQAAEDLLSRLEKLGQEPFAGSLREKISRRFGPS